MKVLFISAEMAPLVKVGGLADVAGALPRALRRLGLDARVVLPMYSTLARSGLNFEQLVSTDFGGVSKTEVNGVPAYLVEHAPSFERDGVYGFDDDIERFLSFCDAALAAASSLSWQPDLIHLNDWHGGFLPRRLAARPDHPWASIPRVLTIHNLGHPGEFTEDFAREQGLSVTTPDGVPATTAHSALAQAILDADAVNAVSPTYAREILTPEFGGELAPLLRLRGDSLTGILNGIDVEVFNPATDRYLAALFDADSLDSRAENKRAIQERLGLQEDDGVPLIGIVTRLFKQKGTDFVPEALLPMLESGDVQLAVLGQGDPEHERLVTELAARHPGRAAAALEFNEPLGQLIYGGSDMFLMPSRYEPCGLGQMIAMRYGSIPVVRRTGGLADSVQPYDGGRNSGVGFAFDEATSDALAAAVREAIAVYRDKPAWRALQIRAMARDVSWDRSAIEYQKMYERAVKAPTVSAGRTR